MLRKNIKEYIEELHAEKNSSQKEIEIFQEEKDYAEKNQLLPEDIGNLAVKDSLSRFLDAYIERSSKETEELIAEEASSFFNQPLEYFKKNKKEFLYVESKSFDRIGIDAVSLEVDDVFGTYDVMLGIKLPKKHEPAIKQFLTEKLQGGKTVFDLMFDQNEGIWNLNFSLESINGFQEEMTIGEAYSMIYHFLFKLVESVEEGKN